jgi:uncharacterized protein YndB with AHSA1/START domain
MIAYRPDRAIHGEIVVPASVAEVWNAWTTEEGVTSFFAPACTIDLRPDGPYEILFDPSAPPGQRGGEGLRVMAVQPMRMLSFTWNAPPSLPQVRGQRTHVVVRLAVEDDHRTRVTLHHDGWGSGGQWEDAFRYFDRAWNQIVLPRLRLRFEQGPIDWQKLQDE